jgi:hypothetical protein
MWFLRIRTRCRQALLRELRRRGVVARQRECCEHCRQALEGGIAALEGRADDAAEMLRDAIEKWRILDSVLDLALTEMDLVVVLGPDHADATVAKEARDIFTQLGAQPFLDQLNAYVGDAWAND